jgi:beta-glucosidase-like glycosyl hydrolase
MDAIKQYVENGEAAAEAIIAGNDLIISATLETHVNEILKAMEEGRITEDQINTACKRVLACKMAYGIIEK